MNRLAALLEQSNQAGVGFLLTELDMALTFLSVADTTRNQETADRNRYNALTAYGCLLRYQGRVTFGVDDQITFNDKFAELKRSLLAVGFAV